MESFILYVLLKLYFEYIQLSRVEHSNNPLNNKATVAVYLLHPYSAPGTLRAVCVPFHWSFTTTVLCGRRYYYLHFTDEEPESKRSSHLMKLTRPQVMEPGCPILNPSDPNGDPMFLAPALYSSGF